MSHITRVKTKLQNLDKIKLALKDLNIEFEEGENLEESELSGHIALFIKLPPSRHRIALSKCPDGSYSLSGEQAVMRMAEEQELLQKLNQRYAYHIVKDKLLEQGFHLESEKQGEESSIHLILRRTS